MKKMFGTMALIALATCYAPKVRGDLVLYDTLPAGGSLSISAEAGQTFATPSDLGLDVRLKGVIMAGPISTTGDFTYALQFFEDFDQDAATWGLGNVLAETPTQTIGIGEQGTFDFRSYNILLDPNTVYGVRFTDGAGTAVGVRIGTETSSTGTGAGTGFLFSGGNRLISLDASARIVSSPVPEPSAALAIPAVALAAWPLVSWRRRRRRHSRSN